MHLPPGTGAAFRPKSAPFLVPLRHTLHYTWNLEPAASSCVMQLHTTASDVAALHIRQFSTTNPAAGRS